LGFDDSDETGFAAGGLSVGTLSVGALGGDTSNGGKFLFGKFAVEGKVVAGYGVEGYVEGVVGSWAAPTYIKDLSPKKNNPKITTAIARRWIELRRNIMLRITGILQSTSVFTQRRFFDGASVQRVADSTVNDKAINCSFDPWC